MYTFLHVDQLTITLSDQNLASWRKVRAGLIVNTRKMTVRLRGFTYGGILKEALYKKLSMLSVHTTPNMAAISIKCCSDKWFLGSNSKINTWLTPDDRQPYTLMPIRNKNSTIRSGPRYNLNAVLRLAPPPS